MADKKMKILPIDFDKPWWDIISQQKTLALAITAMYVFRKIFTTAIPLLLGIIFDTQNQNYFMLFFGTWFFLNLIQFLTRKLIPRFQLQCIHSIHYNAHKYLLQIDPLYHSTGSGGVILGKINRASRAYEHLLDTVMFQLLPLTTGIIVTISVFMRHSIVLGCLILAALIIMIISNLFILKYFIIPYDQKVIKAEDKSKAVSFENLVQIALIRSSFATKEQSERLFQRDFVSMQTEGDLWTMYAIGSFIMRTTYWIATLGVGYFIFWSIKSGGMEMGQGLGTLLTYIRGTYPIMKVERPVRNMVKSLVRIKDLFAFIRTFGEQTYPVLPTKPEATHPIKTSLCKEIKIGAHNLFFDYHKQAKIFDGHSITLDVLSSQDIKLYGIIGPSGSGKTTFLSMLGGQLKPTKGRVSINDIDIYTLDDQQRRQLIALQGQTAASMRGSVRYNLLFGLPRDKSNLYTDNELTHILKQVGLWKMFEEKNGLSTQIGESGTNLSGGQRQRLNFASLYLRAQYYKPLLILIDEPTSSLDSISEKAITNMIVELAKDAVTLVIAHRLKTVEDAHGILDFSFLGKEKEMGFYPHNELLKKSPYYNKLIAGFEPIDI